MWIMDVPTNKNVNKMPSVEAEKTPGLLKKKKNDNVSLVSDHGIGGNFRFYHV